MDGVVCVLSVEGHQVCVHIMTQECRDTVLRRLLIPIPVLERMLWMCVEDHNHPHPPVSKALEKKKLSLCKKVQGRIDI